MSNEPAKPDIKDISAAYPAGSQRETYVLIFVALIGLAGLALLQFSRKSPSSHAANRALVQAENRQGAGDAQASAPLQKIPGELLRFSKQPEAYQPFRFVMAKFSQGAVYEMDLGDGSPRKMFVNGSVQHTYKHSGPSCVTLYARYDGQEVQLDTLHVIVANKKEDVEVLNAIDY
ncbi:MAG: hypothetical protein KGS48_05045 [Bacteroidetes bacterium]|nr:hypothetical protein [Bacteroidota bacterium]